jgi:hypothetical protein
MAGLCREYLQECSLCAAIAVEEAVDGVKLAHMLGGARRELVLRKTAQIILGIDGREARVHVVTDESR